MLYTPHQKQLEVHESSKRFKALNWGRQCFVKGTLISTPNGPTPIERIRTGDIVYSFNTHTQKTQLKKVERLHTFGVDTEPKPMIQLVIDGKTITSTYDHEYYIDNRWVPAYQLAWGVLAPSQRHKLELLCQQYGQTTHNTLQRWLQNENHETSYRWLWVLTNGSRQEDSQATQTHSSDIYTQPQEQTTGKPYKWSETGQSSRELGMGDSARKHRSRITQWLESTKVWRALHQQDNRVTSEGDSQSQVGIETLQSSSIKGTSQTLSPQARLNTRYLKRKELVISSAKVLTSKTSYDLTVADNHNYVVEDILVHNTGKSMFALQYTLFEALKKQGRYWIVLPTYRQAKDVYWNQYIKTSIPQELIKDMNQVDLTITLHYVNDEKNGIKHDTNLPPSTIELKGSDKADLLRGARVNGFVFDEYAYHDPNAWPLIFEPMLLVSKGWALFISTPNGFNHWYDTCNKAQTNEKWFYSHATPYDNPYITNEEIDRIRLDRGEDEFAQEYMAEFRKMEGLVYKEFDRKVHVVTPGDIPTVGTNVIGIDFGYQNPTAAICVRIDYDGNWWVFDEYYERHRTTPEIARVLKEKMSANNYSVVVGDSAAAEHIANLAAQGIPIVPVNKTKDSISAGINLVKTKLKLYEQMHGQPKPKLFISNACLNLIEEFEQYRYPKKRPDGNEKEEPIKDKDHALDALRYLALFYQQNPTNTYDFPEEEIFDNGFYR